jgi:hypothetical protein
MPSGHSTMSVMTYWILYEVTKRNLIERLKHYWLRVTLKIVVGVLCILITLSIMISRIILGVHSYPQIIIGTIVALSVLHNFYFPQFHCNAPAQVQVQDSLHCWWIRNLPTLLHHRNDVPEPLRKRATRLLGVSSSKCEACMGSFVRGQTETLSVIYFYVFFLMCFGFTGPRVESARMRKEIKKID